MATIDSGITLGPGYPGGSGSTFVINLGQTYSASSNYTAALFGPTPTVWTVTNFGIVSSTGYGGSGLYLQAGGTITNANTISGARFGALIHTTPAQVNNQGVITGTNATASAGIKLEAGGTLINSGSIGGGLYGVGLLNGPGLVSNSGTISGTSPSNGMGVQLFSGGTVTNSGSIHGALYGINVPHGTGQVSNTGTITGYLPGSGGAGVQLQGGGTVINGAPSITTALISGGESGGIYVTGGSADLVVNYGTVTGQGTASTGVALFHGGTVRNGTSLDTVARVTGSANGIGIIGATGTVFNDGTVIAALAGSYGIHLFNGGSVANGSAQNTKASVSGVLFGVGFGAYISTLTNFGLITGITGVTTPLGGTVSNAGTIIGTGGTAIAGGTGADTLIVSPGAVFQGTVDAGQGANTLHLASGGAGTLSGLGTQFRNFNTITFDPSAAWKVTGSASALASGQTINGFNAGDAIELTGLHETISSFANNTLTLVGDQTLTLNIVGSFNTADFAAAVQPSGATDISVLCLAEGTRIATPRGAVPVEELREGDLVRSRLTGRDVPVIWIGRRTFACARYLDPAAVWPVRIAAGAFDENVPARDLFLSPDHAIYWDGVLIPVKCLIDGVTIMSVPRDAITYYHVELPSHDVMLAEDLPVESYLDAGDRADFDPGEIIARLRPDFDHRLDAAAAWEMNGAAPLMMRGPVVGAVRRGIAGRHALGQSRSNPPLTFSRSAVM